MPLVFWAPEAPAAVCAGGRRLSCCCCLWCRWCSGRRRARPPARLGVLTSFGAAPRSPPVPSGPSGALHTGGAALLMCGWVRRIEARPGPAAAHERRSHTPIAPQALRWSPIGRACVCPGLPPPTGTAARPSGPSGALYTAGVWSLLSGSARQERRIGRWSWSGPERNIAPADCSSAWHASAVKETSPLLG